MMATPDTYLSHWLAHRGNIWNDDEQTGKSGPGIVHQETDCVCVCVTEDTDKPS